MAWQQLSFEIEACELPRVEALLELAGAASLAIADAGDEPILEPAPGATPLWPAITVRALFDAGIDLPAVADLIARAGVTHIRAAMLDDADIEAAARQPIRPVDIGPRLRIVAAENLADASDRALGLHIGLAFGTGQHPTTRLCLGWLERATTAPGTVLDFGCGTGVLALAALKLGADRATAIDSEPQALAATRRNAALNGLADKLTLGPPEALNDDAFDLILANILAGPLIDLAGKFAGLQVPGGRIVLSGILESQLDAVVSGYTRWYEGLEHRTLEGWSLLTGTRRSGYDR